MGTLPKPDMQKPIIIGLYGVPGSGKTFTNDQLKEHLGEDKFDFYDGSSLIDLVAPGGITTFTASDNEEKKKYREEAITFVAQRCRDNGKTALVTGHCMFWSEGAQSGEWVVTKKDLEVYSHIIYLNVPPEMIWRRRSEDRRRVRPEVSVKHLRRWQAEEIPRLRKACYEHDISFSVLSTSYRPISQPEMSVKHLRRWQAEEIPRLRKACYEHDISFSVLSTSYRPISQALLVEHMMAMIENFTTSSVKNNQSRAEAVLNDMEDIDNLETILFLDGDRTLTVEDTGELFWKAVADIELLTEPGDLHNILFEGPQKYSYSAFLQAMIIFEDVAFRIGRDVYDAICDQVAAAVTFRPEFESLLKLVGEKRTLGAVVVTCGHRMIWQEVLRRAGVSNKVRVIGGGTMDAGYVVTPGVKSDLVAYMRKRCKAGIWAFGDSPVDLAMLREAHEAVVVVGEVNARSKSMESKLPVMLADRPVKAHQLLLPASVTPRLDIEQLPIISMDEIEHRIKSPLIPDLLHATGKGAAQLLMAQTRNALNHGPLLQEAHRAVGRYLALEYLSTAIGLETFSIPHVQAGKSTEASRIADEEKTLIVALMRGGLPMAEGVHEVLRLASILHAKNSADLTLAHLTPQSTVVLIDGVINNGATVKEFVHHIRSLAPKMPIVVVADVVQAKSVSTGGAVWELVHRHKGIKIVALRISENKYTGKGTTDTGNRLFNTTFLQK
nr:hypothetical protein CFP56_60675 [Quercus suber]